jgi:hypothetical protein
MKKTLCVGNIQILKAKYLVSTIPRTIASAFGELWILREDTDHNVKNKVEVIEARPRETMMTTRWFDPSKLQSS